MRKNIFKYLFLFLVFSFYCFPVFAANNTMKIEDVRITEKSSTMTTGEISYSNSSISSELTFNELHDFVTLELDITNNGNTEYTLESITNNINSDYITITSNNIGDIFHINETKTIEVTIKYQNELLNQEQKIFTSANLSFNFSDNSNIVNPNTSSFIIQMIRLLLFFNALTALYLLYKNNKLKKLAYCLLFLLVPVLVFAKEGTSTTLSFENIKIKGRFLDYEITIDDGLGNVEVITKTYGETIELPDPSKNGYTFTGWTNQNGESLSGEITVDNELVITANFEAIEYTITYDLNGGTLETPNPSTYTIESDFTLNNPTKQGFTFAGWTEAGSSVLHTSVTMGPGKTGNRSYTAHYSTNQNTAYTVIHRQMNLNGEYEEFERETLHGATGTDVSPEPKTYTGFITPAPQLKTIAADGSTVFTYDYERETYTFRITNRTDIITATADGSYYYGTIISITASSKEGYTPRWNDGNTSLTREFVLTKNTILTLSYIPRTDTPYKVIHKKQKLVGDEYEVALEEELEGTTGASITPGVNTYTGFTSPSPQTVTIKADGTTEVIYLYDRTVYSLTLENSSDIETTTPSGAYRYGTSITLKAKTKSGYRFVKWSNEVTTNPYTFEITSDITIGPLYTANDNASYTVYHKKQNISGNGYDLAETEVLTGPSGSKVTPSVRVYEGFTAPEQEEITINDDNTAELTYYYTRNQYTFTLSNTTDVVSTKASGTYYYGTSITLTANTKQGYTFTKWSNNVTDNPYTFTLTGNTTIDAIYTANTNTPYKVIHKKQNLTATGYEVAEEETLYGTTNQQVTPAVKTYQGFTAPTPVQITINSAGTTELTYNYTRNQYNLTLTDAEYIETTTASGRYYYETSITLTAIERNGYTFEKWSNDVTDNPYTFTLTEDTTIGPVYSSEKYVITLNPNGGSVSPTTIEVLQGQSIGTIPTPTRTSYLFYAWYTATSDGEKIDSNYVPTGDMTIYARWYTSSNVCVMDGVFYNTLQAAVNQVPIIEGTPTESDYKTIEVLKNFTGNATISAGRYVILDLKNYTITYGDGNVLKTSGYLSVSNGTIKCSAGSGAIDVESGGSLYLSDMTVNATGTRQAVYNTNGYAEVENVTLTSSTGERATFHNLNGATSVIKSGTITSTGMSAIKNDAGTVIIGVPDGDITTSTPYITGETFGVETAGTIKFYDGTLRGKDQAINDETKIVEFETDSSKVKETVEAYKIMYLEVPNSYKVTFNPNEGTLETTARYVEIDSAIGELPIPTREGYYLDGWYTLPDGGDKVTSSYVPQGNITLYAKWKKSIASAIIQNDSLIIPIGGTESIVITNANEIEEPYTFESSNTDVATVDEFGVVTMVSSGNATITIRGTNSNKTKTIQVSSPKYIITFNANGGTVSPESKEVFPGNSIGTLPVPTSTKAHTTFIGWFTSLNSETPINELYEPTGDMELVAKWEYHPESTFESGESVNIKMKTASGSSSPSISTYNSKIKKIKKATALPSDFTPATNNTVSTSDSDEPIYIWFNNDEEYLYYYTDSETIYLNTYASYMFINLYYLGSIENINNWNASKVYSTQSMFQSTGEYASSFSIDLSSWDTKNMRYMTQMFCYAGRDSSTWSIGDISNWNVSNATSMKYMFTYAGMYTTDWSIGDLSNWNTSKVTNMQGMFLSAGYKSQIWTVGHLDNWNVSNVTNMNGMFSLEGQEGDYFNSTVETWSIGDISNWNTSKVTDMSFMFSMTAQHNTTFDIGDLSNWDVSKVTNMRCMFQHTGENATIFNLGDLSNWNTSAVTNMSNLFYYAGSASQTWNIGYLTNWDVSNVTDMKGMFTKAGKSASTFDIGYLDKWNTSKVTKMSTMFDGAGENATTWNIGDLSNWDVSNVTEFNGMFEFAGSQTKNWHIGDLSNWNISSATLLRYMFYKAGYNSDRWDIGDLSNWDTRNVTEIHHMFSFAGYNSNVWNSIGTLNIYANNIGGMFYKCPKAKATLNIYTKPTTIEAKNSDDDDPDGNQDHGTFELAATDNHALITVNYASVVDNIDDIIATKSNDSHVVKGNTLTSNYVVTLNVNSETGSVSPERINVKAEESIGELPIPTNKDKTLIFSGWYSTPTDGTEIESTYVPTTNIEIYAIWRTASTTTLLDGSTFNQRIKTIAGNSTVSTTSDDNNIYTIKKATALPTGFVATSANTISTSTSNLPAYAWYNSNEKTLYYYSDADTIYLSANSGYMFSCLLQLRTIEGIEKWNTSNVTSISYMFNKAGYNAPSFELDLTGWDTSKVTTIRSLFYYSGYYATTWSVQGLSDWNTSSMQTLWDAFNFTAYSAEEFVIDLSKWNVSNATDMDSMFQYSGYSATKWQVGDLSNWDTSKVSYFTEMFAYAGYNATNWVSIGTLKIRSSSQSSVFSQCPHAKATLIEQSAPGSYSSMFSNAATANDALIVVNYTSEATNIDTLINTKSTNSNVIKGTTDTNLNVVYLYENGGKVTPQVLYIEKNTAIGTLPVPEKKGYYYTGWYTELNGGEKVTEEYIVEKDCKLYTRWIKSVDGMIISNSTIILSLNQEATIDITNKGSIEEEYTFASSDTSIATVDQSGKVKLLSPGDTTITITGETSNQTKEVIITSPVYTINLNANGGSVSPTSIRVIQGNNIGTLPTPTTTQNHTTFLGWFTGVETGDEVTENTIPEGNITIYARWEYHPESTFDTGVNVNVKIKTLSGVENPTYQKWEETTEAIKKATSLPTNFNATTDNIVSTSDSDEPIYIWFDSTDNVIYYYTDSSVIYLNQNSSSMFAYLRKVSTIEGINDWNTSKLKYISDMFSGTGYKASSFEINLTSWDVSRVQNFSNLFNGCGYDATTWSIGDISNWNVSNATSMLQMFMGAAYKATTFELNLSNWNVSNVNNMKSMFSSAGYTATTWKIGDLSNWNTSKATSMMQMFSSAGYNATTFYFGDISGWDTSNVTDMTRMFGSFRYNYQNAITLNISNWNTSKVTNMSYMFNCAGFKATTFEMDLSNWDVSKVTSMENMFGSVGHNATTWSIGDLSDWDTSNVTTMKGMFTYAGENTTTWSIGNLSTWDTSKVITMQSMFIGAGSKSTTWSSIGSLDVYADDITAMFYNCSKAKATLNIFIKPTYYASTQYVSNPIFSLAATASNALITVNYTSAVDNIDDIIATKSTNSNVVKGRNLDNDIVINLDANGGTVRPETVRYVPGSGVLNLPTPTTTQNKTTFEGWYTLPNGGELVDSNYTPSGNITIYAKWLYHPDAIFESGSTINVKIKNMVGSITNATTNTTDSNLEQIKLASSLSNDFVATTANTISSNDSDAPIYMWYDSNEKILYYYTDADKIYISSGYMMFKDLRNLQSIENISSWDNSNNTTFEKMFYFTGYNTQSFNISISSWDTSNVTTAYQMLTYAGYKATTWSVGSLANWNTIKLTNTAEMFNNAGNKASSFEIDLTDWNVSNVTDFHQMFTNAGENATTWSVGDLSDWNVSSATSMYNMFSFAGSRAATWGIGDLSNWDISHAGNISMMFYGAGQYATTWNSIGTLNIYSDVIGGLFNSCPKAQATLNIYNKPSNFVGAYPNTYAFGSAATANGSLITVNYTSAVDNIDDIIATKSANSNVVKGSLITA